jgi:predicted SAM-dependent methyltransferase
MLSQFKARLKTKVPPKLWGKLQRIWQATRKATGPYISPLLGRLILVNLKASRKRQIAEYFASHPVRKLQLAAGANSLPGWLNSEAFVPSSFTHSLSVADGYIYLDVCAHFPFDDNSVDYVFHEHVIEHLSYQQGQFMLKECLRILKPGGRLRSATPDLETFVKLYGKSPSAEQKLFMTEYVRFNSGIWSSDLKHVTDNHAVFVINHNVRAWGHQFIYDFATMSAILKGVGFSDITRREPQKSPDIHLANLEFRKEIVGNFDALIVEARKP